MSNRKITRRNFLLLIGAATGSCALSCVGLGALSSIKDLSGLVMPMGLPELTIQGNPAKKKILVAYASNTGSTGGVAEAIGKSLAETGRSVDVRPLNSAIHLDEYGAVVVGSPINNGKWLSPATQFVTSNQDQLNQIPTAFFQVGLMANKKSESDRKLVDQFLDTERALVPPVAEGRFVGVMFTKGFTGLERLGIHFFIAYCGLGLRGGDFRNPTAVRGWAENLRDLI